jgi:hypothetical protein
MKKHCPECESKLSERLPCCVKCGHILYQSKIHIHYGSWTNYSEYGKLLIDLSFASLFVGFASFIYGFPSIIYYGFAAIAATLFIGGISLLIIKAAIHYLIRIPCVSCGSPTSRVWFENNVKWAMCDSCIAEYNDNGTPF